MLEYWNIGPRIQFGMASGWRELINFNIIKFYS